MVAELAKFVNLKNGKKMKEKESAGELSDKSKSPDHKKVGMH